MVIQPVTRDEMERVFREAAERIERAYAKAGWLRPMRDPFEVLRRDAELRGQSSSAIPPYMDTDDDRHDPPDGTGGTGGAPPGLTPGPKIREFSY
jgi:hypothetical protein